MLTFWSIVWHLKSCCFCILQSLKRANWSSWFHKNPNAYNHTHFWISRYCWVTKFVCPFLYFWIRNVAGVGRQANGHTRFIDSSLCSAGRVLLFIPKHTEGHQDTQIFIPKHTGGHQKYLVARLQNMNCLGIPQSCQGFQIMAVWLCYTFENPN